MKNTESAIENLNRLQKMANFDMKSLMSLTHVIEERKVIALKLLQGSLSQEDHNLVMEYIERVNEKIKQAIGV